MEGPDRLATGRDQPFDLLADPANEFRYPVIVHLGGQARCQRGGHPFLDEDPDQPGRHDPQARDPQPPPQRAGRKPTAGVHDQHRQKHRPAVDVELHPVPRRTRPVPRRPPPRRVGQSGGQQHRRRDSVSGGPDAGATRRAEPPLDGRRRRAKCEAGEERPPPPGRHHCPWRGHQLSNHDRNRRWSAWNSSTEPTRKAQWWGQFRTQAGPDGEV